MGLTYETGAGRMLAGRWLDPGRTLAGAVPVLAMHRPQTRALEHVLRSAGPPLCVSYSVNTSNPDIGLDENNRSINIANYSSKQRINSIERQ